MRVPTKDYERQNRFEANLARYHGVAHAIGMASGMMRAPVQPGARWA